MSNALAIKRVAGGGESSPASKPASLNADFGSNLTSLCLYREFPVGCQQINVPSFASDTNREFLQLTQEEVATNLSPFWDNPSRPYIGTKYSQSTGIVAASKTG